MAHFSYFCQIYAMALAYAVLWHLPSENLQFQVILKAKAVASSVTFSDKGRRDVAPCYFLKNHKTRRCVKIQVPDTAPYHYVRRPKPTYITTNFTEVSPMRAI